MKYTFRPDLPFVLGSQEPGGTAGFWPLPDGRLRMTQAGGGREMNANLDRNAVEMFRDYLTAWLEADPQGGFVENGTGKD